MHSLDNWRQLYGNLPQSNLPEHLNPDGLEKILKNLEKKLQGNYPFHHPQYAGQMLKPPHPLAWLAYTLAMTINPNNHALDGGPPTSEMEKDVIKQLANMIGYGANHLGHLTTGGTIANLEALFVARESHPEKAIAASANAHYTHSRMCRILNCEFLEIPVDENGRPDLDFIKKNAAGIGTLVVTMGTTGLGIVEPLQDLLAIAKENGIRLHADAAYGGFYKLIGHDLPAARHWELLNECDSVVIDPHKHGLQPYGCGSVLFKDATVGKYFKHDSPYTYFTSQDLHLGEISLECSRAGASAAALWATLQLLPLTKTGLGNILQKTRASSLKFAGLIKKNHNWQLYAEPELDITGYFKKPDGKKLSDLNKVNKTVFDTGMNDIEAGFHLSLFKIPAEIFLKKFPGYEADEPSAVILRSVFMKEEHHEFIDELAGRIFSV